MRDYGDACLSPAAHDHAALLQSVQPLVARAVREGHFPLALGGDHSVSYALVKSLGEALG